MKLHIGGTIPHPEWKILNVVADDHVDYVGNCTDLSLFGDGSVAEVYMSHVLEHLARRERAQCLLEVNRILETGGKLYIAVPDMTTLCQLFLHENATLGIRLGVNNILFGGSVEPDAGIYHFHKFGYSFELLQFFLECCGFSGISRVDSFGIFNDASDYVYCGLRVSLNVLASKSGKVVSVHPNLLL